METSNNPDLGTASATDTISEADTFKALLDSERATTDIGRTETNEAVDASTSEDEIEDDAEQPDEDSEGVEGDEIEDAADNEEADDSTTLSDDTLVDVNGEKITLKELKAGQLRQSDYTKKMQEISALRKQWMVNEIDKQQIRSAVKQQIDGLMAVVSEEFNLIEPNWEAEWENDPYEAQKKKFAWDKQQATRLARLQQIGAQKAAFEEQTRQLEAEQTRQRKIEAREFLASDMPDVFGDKHANANLGAVETFLNEQGVPADMIAGIDNPVLIKLAYYAMKHLQVAKQVPKAVKAVEAKPIMAPAATSASKKSSVDHFTNSIRKYQRTGSEDDATAIFKDLLNN